MYIFNFSVFLCFRWHFIHVFYYDILFTFSIKPFKPFNREPAFQSRAAPPRETLSPALPSSGRYESDVIRRKWKRSSRPLSGKKEVEEELPPLSRRRSWLAAWRHVILRSRDLSSPIRSGYVRDDGSDGRHIGFISYRRALAGSLGRISLYFCFPAMDITPTNIRIILRIYNVYLFHLN